MEEFKLAHYNMVHRDKKYLVVILLESLDIGALPRDLQMYLRTYTYIDATKQPRNLPLYASFHFLGMLSNLWWPCLS